MTLTADTPAVSPAATPSIRQHYWVRMPEPASHLFEIELRFDGLDRDLLTLRFPVWTPGSYLVREYARHLQDFAVFDREDRPVAWQRADKQTWEIDTRDVGDRVRVHYRLYAYDLTVRTNHLDTTHGFFTGAATFLYAEDRRDDPIQLTVCPPQAGWAIATALDPMNESAKSGEPGSFVARNFDELVDSPVEVGIHQNQHFEILNKPHEFVVWGHGNEKLDRIVADTQKIIETEAKLFGGLPYDRYVFLLHLSASGGGGLEHKNSTVLNYPRFAFSNPERYDRFLSLVAHEFFHLWNVKRLRPEALETFDYDRESYLRCLWFCEGTTSYYDTLILRRANLISVDTYLKLLSKRVGQLQSIPGRRVQSLVGSSFETWIKLYRPTENTSNSQVSYYLKGEIVTMLLDLAIRDRSQHCHSLDTVMRDLWQQFGQFEKGYTDADLRAAFERAATANLSDLFSAYIDGTTELDYDRFLEPFGLKLNANPNETSPVPKAGLTLKTEAGTTKVTKVEMGSSGQVAGIWSGDELLALDGYKVTAETWSDRLKDYKPGQTVHLSIFQREELKQVEVTLAAPVADRYTISPIESPTDEQRQACTNWLGGFPSSKD